jgi:hypothetical protein
MRIAFFNRCFTSTTVLGFQPHSLFFFPQADSNGRHGLFVVGFSYLVTTPTCATSAYSTLFAASVLGNLFLYR